MACDQSEQDRQDWRDLQVAVHGSPDHRAPGLAARLTWAGIETDATWVVRVRVDLQLDHNVAALESIITVPDEELGPLKMQNVLFRMLGTPGRVRWSGRRLGQDTEAVLGELGIPPEQVAELRARGVV